MHNAIIVLSFAVVSATTAAPKTFTVEGKPLVAAVDTISPALEVTPQAGSKTPAVATYLAYMNALAAGSIREAAALTSAPAKTTTKQNAYLDRLGGIDAFKASYAKVLTEHLKLTHVITKDTGVLIIGQHPEHGPFATFLTCAGAKCAIADELDAPPLSELAKLFGLLREGSITL